MSRYSLVVGNDETAYTVDGTRPAAALRALCAAAGLCLASQDGRYGRLADGTKVFAMTETWTVRRYAHHGTQRPLPGTRSAR